MRIFAAVLVFFAAPAFAAKLTEEDAAKKAHAAIARGHWSSVDANCLSLEPSAPEWTFVVREEHNDACGGDPLTAPHLFDVKVDPWTGVATKDDPWSP